MKNYVGWAHQLQDVIQIRKNDEVFERKKQIQIDNIKSLNKIVE
ncbi:unnamed protein product [Paramecium sonneborni]|uniref:Uncharacterized protein n=1 Tax=Paramecium sonneborni TaxID=65129 RepID=A0A8S1K720_9CILI|nr:unnamed protein product [Paramecium sonneborni]